MKIVKKPMQVLSVRAYCEECGEELFFTSSKWNQDEDKLEITLSCYNGHEEKTFDQNATYPNVEYMEIEDVSNSSNQAG